MATFMLRKLPKTVQEDMLEMNFRTLRTIKRVGGTPSCHAMKAFELLRGLCGRSYIQAKSKNDSVYVYGYRVIYCSNCMFVVRGPGNCTECRVRFGIQK